MQIPDWFLPEHTPSHKPLRKRLRRLPDTGWAPPGRFDSSVGDVEESTMALMHSCVSSFSRIAQLQQNILRFLHNSLTLADRGYNSLTFRGPDEPISISASVSVPGGPCPAHCGDHRGKQAERRAETRERRTAARACVEAAGRISQSDEDNSLRKPQPHSSVRHRLWPTLSSHRGTWPLMADLS